MLQATKFNINGYFFPSEISLATSNPNYGIKLAPNGTNVPACRAADTSKTLGQQV